MQFAIVSFILFQSFAKDLLVIYCDSGSEAEGLCEQLFSAISIQYLQPIAYFVLYFPFMVPFYKNGLFSATGMSKMHIFH